VGFQPEDARHNGRINPNLAPPRGLVAAAVEVATVSAAQWDRELIADLAAQGQALRKTQMVSVRRSPAANQAGGSPASLIRGVMQASPWLVQSWRAAGLGRLAIHRIVKVG
jgi:hypothetical protein